MICSLLYNCFPRAYKLLRFTKNIIFPSSSAIRKVILPIYMNHIVKHHNNFVLYIKNKFKLLEEMYITVSLFVDEIHLKHYFDYKASNIVGLADSSNESATSDLLLCILMNVVHIIPTKYLKAENLFVIEERGFWKISVVTDINAINKNAISFL